MFKEYISINKSTGGASLNYWDSLYKNTGNRFHLLERLKLDKRWKLLRSMIPNGALLLEAGCGKGQWVRLASNSGYKCVGMDYVQPLVRALHNAYSENIWAIADILHLPFKDNSFDGILSWGVVEHFDNGPEPIICEFRRVLKDGGLTFITVPFYNEYYKKKYIGLQSNRHTIKGGAAFHQHLMSEEELEILVCNAGLKPVYTARLNPQISKMFPIFQKLPFAVYRQVNKLFSFMVPSKYSKMLLCIGKK